MAHAQTYNTGSIYKHLSLLWAALVQYQKDLALADKVEGDAAQDALQAAYDKNINSIQEHIGEPD